MAKSLPIEIVSLKLLLYFLNIYSKHIIEFPTFANSKPNDPNTMDDLANSLANFGCDFLIAKH